MKLTPEQFSAVVDPGHVSIDACPGSGKTRAVVARLLRSSERLGKGSRRVACITYTNTAVYEIEHRLRASGVCLDNETVEVGTIHSFCLNNIIRQCHHLLPAFEDGFAVLAPEDGEYQSIAREALETHGVKAADQRDLELVHRSIEGLPQIPPKSSLTEDCVRDFWGRLHERGFLDFTNIVYFSFVIVRAWPAVAKGLSALFESIVVDEFQDTSGLQVEILRAIAKYGRTRFFLVGDPNQSIFGFAGARPALMTEFAEELGSASQHHFTGNFRASRNLIASAEALLPRAPQMVAVGECADYAAQPVVVETSAPVAGVLEAFLPVIASHKIPIGKAAILAPAWFGLQSLGRQLREAGVDVTGPGSRPYKTKRLFARLAEQTCAYAVSAEGRYVLQTERELYRMILEATGAAPTGLRSWRGQCLVFRLLRESSELGERCPGGLVWLKEASKSFTMILRAAGYELGDRLIISAEEIVRDIENSPVDAANLSISDLGVYARPDSCMKLMTIHGAKGREFDAVAMISLHEGVLPYYNFYSPCTHETIEDDRRKMYVAATRARKVMMYILHPDGKGRAVSRFVKELGPVDLATQSGPTAS